ADAAHGYADRWASTLTKIKPATRWRRQAEGGDTSITGCSAGSLLIASKVPTKGVFGTCRTPRRGSSRSITIHIAIASTTPQTESSGGEWRRLAFQPNQATSVNFPCSSLRRLI